MAAGELSSAHKHTLLQIADEMKSGQRDWVLAIAYHGTTLNALTRRGLIERGTGGTSGTSRIVRLTESGKARAGELHKGRYQHERGAKTLPEAYAA